MSDIKQDIPDPDAVPEGSSEWGFDNDRDQKQDDQQAEASQYGRYGYQDQRGESYVKNEPSVDELTTSEPEANNTPQAQEDPTIRRQQGGQDLTETQHGSGIAQPLEEPQRSASHSPTPDEA